MDENEQKKKHYLIMFEGYQECVISSTSSHARTYCWGGVKWCNIVLKLLVRKWWNPLSCQPLHIDKYTHTVYGVLSFCCYTCVNHSLSIRKEALTTKTSPCQQGHRETKSHRRQSIILHARARPATDSNRDDNSSTVVWRLILNYTMQREQYRLAKHSHTNQRAQKCLF